MPTYEYACTACADRFEVVQSFVDAALTECKACGGRLRKVFAPVGVVFKGSGFYRTDNRKSSDPKPAAEAKPAESKSSDAKPAAAKPAAASPSPSPAT